MTHIFYDLKTTGTDFRKHSIFQLGIIVESNGVTLEKIQIDSQPHPKAQIDPAALVVAGKTLEEIQSYQDMTLAHAQFVEILGFYIGRFNPKDKAWLVGFNNRVFDDQFLRAWFSQNGDRYFGSWFWSDTIDVSVLASQKLMPRRAQMKSFKLKRVAEELGIQFDSEKAHSALYDAEITQKIYSLLK